MLSPSSNSESSDVICHDCFSTKSRTGLISVMLGMTVCFSTLWRFPYQVASFGGAAYLGIYFILAALFVYPALTAEWGLGRFTGRGPDGAYNQVRFPGGKAVSVLLFLIVLAVGSYFVVWIGWILRYAFSAIFDSRLTAVTTQSTEYFETTVAADPVSQFAFTAIVVLAIAIPLLRGTRRIEQISKLVVPIFYGSVSVLTILVFLQPGVFSNVIGYLTTINITEQVTSYTFVAALGQAFFSLCLGGSYMVLYASYMQRKSTHDIPVNAGLTLIGNTVASLISVLLVFGVISLAGIGMSNAETFGPGLFFGVIPEVFKTLGIGVSGLGMSIFFLMFFLAAYLPLTAIFEVTIVYLVDNIGISRKQAYLVIGFLTMLLAIPSMLSPLDGGFLYNLDLFVGATGSVIGSIIAIIAFGWFVPKKMALKEVNTASRFKLGNKWHFWVKYVQPFFLVYVILYAFSDIIVGTFGLNAIPGDAYVFYSLISSMAPWLALVLTIFIFLLVLYDHRRTRRVGTSAA
ncbi:MAG: sodium-dependent transporter [Candidatus Heimdallarchaeota archaeon]